MRDVQTMTDDELVTEWLECERFAGDPTDEAHIPDAHARQLEIEAEQDRREIRGEVA